MTTKDENLAHLIEQRKYGSFEKVIANRLRRKSWNDIVYELERITKQREAVVGWGIPLRWGILRDAMINLLHLTEYAGISFDLGGFRNLEGDSLSQLRVVATEYAQTLLESQIRSGNTFFLDTDQMKESSLVVYMPQILETRQKELHDLETESELQDIYSTYYGFTILTRGMMGLEEGRMPKRIIDTLEELTREFGNTIQVNDSQISYHENAFGNADQYTRELLWNLLSLCTAGNFDQEKAANNLGLIGDARALNLLHDRLRSTMDRRVWGAIVSALGLIGHPSSFEALQEILLGGNQPWEMKFVHLNQDQRAAAIAMGGIRHPIAERQVKEAASDSTYPIESFGLTRNPDYVDMIVNRLDQIRNRNPTRILSHLSALKNTGSLGARIVVNKYSHKLMQNRRLASGIIRLLSSISTYSWSEDVVEEIAQIIDGESGTEEILRAISEDAFLVAHPKVRAAAVALLEQSEDTPEWTRLKRIIESLLVNAENLAE